MSRAPHWQLLNRMGFSTFPLYPNSKTPALDWEVFQTTRPDPSVWMDGPWNLAVATGPVSGAIVLDHDNAEAAAWIRAQGPLDTFTVATPRGEHFYLQPPPFRQGNRANLLKGIGPRGVDIRAEGGYVVGPGSFYIPTAEEMAKGKIAGPYAITRNVPIAPCPPWLLALLERPDAPIRPPAAARVAEITSPYGHRALREELERLAAAQDGEVNDTINAVCFAIGQLVGGGEIRADEAEESLVEVLAGLGVGDEYKANETFQRSYAEGIDQPRAAPAGLTPEQAFGTGPIITLDEVAPAARRDFAPTLFAYDLPDYFAGCVYVSALDKVYIPGGRLVGASAFDTHYGGHLFPMTYEGTKPTFSAWSCFRTSQVWRPTIADKLCFRPELPAGKVAEIEDRWLLNSYQPLNIRLVPGDPTPFLDFLERVLPDERDRRILLSYMAAVRQNPGLKAQWWPVLQGAEGNGKTLLLSCMSYAVGERYTHLVNPEAMAKTGNQFNAWIEGHLFVGLEEIYMADRRDFLESFKTTVTNRRMPIEAKGGGQGTGDNRANGMMLTNHRRAIPVTVDTRRYAIFYMAQQTYAHILESGMGGAYFPKLYEWLYGDGFAIVAHYLSHYVPDAEFNPAGMCQRAPETSSAHQARAESLGRAEREVLEAIAEGRQGFAGGWVSSVFLARLFDQLRIKMNRNAYGELMQSLNYVPHPHLVGGRTNNAVAPDGAKPVLYILSGHLACNLTTAPEIAKAYTAAQSRVDNEAAATAFKRP